MRKPRAAERPVTNPFYERVCRDGLCVRVDCPLDAGRRPTNPYYDRVREGGGVRIKRGRPRRGAARAETSVKTVRLSKETWRRLDEQAARERLSCSEAVREAVLTWLRS